MTPAATRWHKRGIRSALRCVGALALSACAAARVPLAPTHPIPAPTVRPFADGIEWLLVEPLTYQLRDSGPSITVPAGFVTDFASVPRAFWGIIAPLGYHARAAIVHDFLYWEQGCTRAEADGLFLLGMIASNVEVSTRKTMYSAVRKHGESAWHDNARERARGLPRVIPPEFWKLPDDVRWPTYRETLFASGVRADTQRVERPTYCAVGGTVAATYR